MKSGEYYNISSHIFESYVNIARNISMELSCELHGKINVHYNAVTDSLQVMISNRALNIEPFRLTYPYFSKEMVNGTNSSTLSRFILKEYRDYVNLYLFKKY